MTKQLMAAVAMMLIAGSASVPAQTASSHKKTAKTHKKAVPKAHVESATERELREMREELRGQQAQIDALRQLNADKDARLATASADAQAAAAAAVIATAQAQTVNASVQANSDAITAVSSTVSDLKAANTGLAQTVSDTKRDLTAAIESPSTMHYKGMTITPVAFFAFEGVYRGRSINSDINTPFNTTPFPGSNEGHISELNFSARQSRLGGLLEGRAAKFKLSGYFETDFLSAGVTSNENQSNSYTLRVRQIWGKAETDKGFGLTGGQTWSLVTEDGKSTDVRTEKLPNTIDPQYMVGFSWARQPTIRLQQKFGAPNTKGGVTVAMSVEQAQTQLATTANAPANFIFGGTGTGGGLLNAFNGTYANNVAPDVIVKAAFDAPKAHLELGGLTRFFRDEYNPLIVNAAGVTTGYSNTVINKDTKVGGGVFGSARVTTGKYLDVAAQGMAGDGTARYGSSQLGDVTVHPNGTLEPIRNYHGMFSLEGHASPKLDLFAYYGAEYNQRTVYVSTAGLLTGYGVPNANDTGCYATTLGSATTGVGGTGGVNGAPGTVTSSTGGNICASPTKLIGEGMAGFTYRAVNNPRYGRLQYSATYSYLTKQTWNGVLSGTYGSPTAVYGAGRATNGMVHVGMRYYIP